MKSFISFLVGAVVGTGCAALVLKKYYERIADEEIESVKQSFNDKKESNPVKMSNDEKNTDSTVTSKLDETIGEVDTLKSIIKSNNYSNYSKKDKEESPMEDKPYVISPEEFGELDGYETISLTYHSDNVLTDDMDEPIEDVEECIGLESLNHFGEYEDDSVFVRNDARRCDYEILMDEEPYSEVQHDSWNND